MRKADQLTSEVFRLKLKKDFAFLVQVDNNSLVTAAKNVRIELKRAFPGIKFSVKTSRFSGGDSLRVHWTDGPSTSQVDQIINKYSSGSFDGMTDCYNYDMSEFNDLFGDAKYCSTSREYSDQTVDSIIHQVAEDFGGCVPITVDDFRRGFAWNWRNPGGCDLGRELNIRLSAFTEFSDSEMEVAA